MPTSPTVDKDPPQDVILMNSDDDSSSHTTLNSQYPLSKARISKGDRSAKYEELTLRESPSNNDQSLNNTPLYIALRTNNKNSWYYVRPKKRKTKTLTTHSSKTSSQTIIHKRPHEEQQWSQHRHDKSLCSQDNISHCHLHNVLR